MTRAHPGTMALALAVLCRCVAAQAPATVLGTVRDTAGRPVSRAAVTVPFSGRSVLTDAAGRYRLTPLPPGHHTLVVRALGYRPAQDSVVVAAGDTAVRDFVLGASAIDVAPVVVTAAKRSQLLEEAVATVAVVDQTDLANRALNTVDEAVDKAPAVALLDGQVNIRGSSGYVRGLGSRVLLLVDGVPANQGDRGGISWDLLPVDAVEHAEIVKGAGSALYGSAALGGVVNLITRDVPVGTHWRARTTGGVFADPPHDVWAFRSTTGLQGGIDVSGSTGSERLRGRFAVGARHTDGYREQDAGDHWHLAGRAQWFGPSGRDRLDLSGAWAVNRYQVPLQWCVKGLCDDRGQAYQPFRIDTTIRGDRTDSRKGYLTAVYARTASDRMEWQVRGSWLRTHFTDSHRSGNDFSVANRWGGEVRAQVHTDARQVVTVGAEGAYADVWSNIFGTHTQSEYAAYGESEVRMGPARASVGARIDFLAVDAGGLTALVSPRVGMVLPTAAGAWRASAGRGFRAPALAERFVSTTVGPFNVIPNPALQPETAWSFELGTTLPIGRLVLLDAALFWNDVADLVDPVLNDSLFQIQIQNVAHARLRGVDASATVVAAGDRLRAGVAYLLLDAVELARDTLPQRPLTFRPRHLLTLSADYRVWRRLSVGADWRYISRLARVDLYENEPRLAARVLDLRALWSAEPLAVRVALSNALNYIYGLLPRTLAPVRTVSVALTWTR